MIVLILRYNSSVVREIITLFLLFNICERYELSFKLLKRQVPHLLVARYTTVEFILTIIETIFYIAVF